MEFAFNAFVTLLVVVDPLGLAPIFASLTRGFSEEQKRASAIRGTLLGALSFWQDQGPSPRSSSLRAAAALAR
jgi:small neutral amino acid transporter SnatA (MarC family)